MVTKLEKCLWLLKPLFEHARVDTQFQHVCSHLSLQQDVLLGASWQAW